MNSDGVEFHASDCSPYESTASKICENLEIILDATISYTIEDCNHESRLR